MLLSEEQSLSSMNMRLTTTIFLRNLKVLSGCQRSTMVFHTGNYSQLNPSSRSQDPPAGTPRIMLPTKGSAQPVGQYNQCDQHSQQQEKRKLQDRLKASNRHLQAAMVVIQHTWEEREDAQKQRVELTQELVSLRGELVSTVTACEKLEQEKEELQVMFEGILQKLQEQQQRDLADLEERLRVFYQAEWEKVHEAYQEQADKYRTEMQQQVDDLRSKHEVSMREMQAKHSEEVQNMKQHYEASLQELRKAHEQEMLSLDKSMKEAETALSKQIQELVLENNSLSEKIKVEEERKEMLPEQNLKDPHTLYLEQELESLRVVLDIKSKQLHQQDQKLMQMDKLTERNMQLDECLRKVQQENEDLKVRMDKHAALSRQLSTEQAVLQESLQKESKVNKRLSMENEELLWKLYNGDLSSPRKLSPSSTPLSLQSPRSSGIFSSAPVSPR